MREIEKKNWLAQTVASGVLNTPYMLTDLDIIRQKAELFKQLMPRIGVYYAMKSNDDPKVISILNDIIDGYDIASLGEFKKLHDLGIDSDRIVYSNPVKIPQHIDETYKQGVRYYALDSLTEIEKLAQYAPGSTVYVRIRVPDYGSKFPLSGKFGLDPLHVAAYAATAKEAGLNVKGLAFHVGSQSENTQVWKVAFQTCKKLIDELSKIGIDIEFIDMGGGFPAGYEELAPGIEEAAKAINESIDAYMPEGMRIFAEPGRYVSANASVLVTSVIGREHRGGTDWLYLDMGVFQGLMEPLEMSDWKYPIFTDKSPKGYRKSFVLTGPSCDAYDTIGMDYELPSDINVGDKLYIGAVGAYSLVYGSNFNGFEIPKTYYVNHEGEK
ncbi:MAG: type III PLP-dependent enzyme [Candidatus Saccharibacteria bacterium]